MYSLPVPLRRWFLERLTQEFKKQEEIMEEGRRK